MYGRSTAVADRSKACSSPSQHKRSPRKPRRSVSGGGHRRGIACTYPDPKVQTLDPTDPGKLYSNITLQCRSKQLTRWIGMWKSSAIVH